LRTVYILLKKSRVDMSEPANTFGGHFSNLSNDIRFYDVREYIKYLKNNHPDLSLDRFRPEYSMMEDMREAFVSAQKLATPNDISPDGTVKLRLVFEALNGKYSYREIHLAELFL